MWLHNFEIPDSSNVLQLGDHVLLRPLRFMSGNPIITEQHLANMIDRVRAAGDEVVSDIIKQSEAANLSLPNHTATATTTNNASSFGDRDDVTHTHTHTYTHTHV